MLRFTFPILLPIALSGALLLAPATHGQTWHQVGTGTATNGANGIPCPFGDIYAGQRAQYVYLASELSAAGLAAGDALVSVRWVVTALNGSGMHENYTIRLGNTTATSLTGLLANPTGASTTPIDYQPVVGNNDFQLRSPFVWNGTSNLLVEVSHFSATYGEASANASVAFTSTAPVKRSFSLLDDLMFIADQTFPFDGETLNSTGLPNIVLGVGETCGPLAVQGVDACVGDATNEALSGSGCTEGLGGLFTATFIFPGSNFACTGTDFTERSVLTLPPLPDGAVVQAGRLRLTQVQADDPVWLSDLYMSLTGAIEGDVQLMPAFDEYSGVVPELMISMNGPYEAGDVHLRTASTFGTGMIGGALVEFDYLLPTPLWYDAPVGGDLIAYGVETLDPVALGLVDPEVPGTTTFYLDCGLSSTGCIAEPTPVDFVVAPVPEPAFTVGTEDVLAGTPVTLTYTGSNDAETFHWDFGDGTTSDVQDVEHTWPLPGTYAVTLTVSNGDCTASSTQEVQVEVGTGIAEGIGTDMRAYAADGDFVIEGIPATGPVAVDVLDGLGRVVLHAEPAATARLLIPASGLGPGIWFVRLNDGAERRTFRVPLVR